MVLGLLRSGRWIGTGVSLLPCNLDRDAGVAACIRRPISHHLAMLEFEGRSVIAWKGPTMTYEIQSELGRGGFGIVELVVDTVTGREYARKALNAAGQPNISKDDLVARFQREVRYQSQMNHPNVVGIVDSDLESDPPWFIMELADGSLADELSRDRTLGGQPTQAIFDILAGLQAMHELGFKHRDLKPANVLRFTDADGSTRYAISDFGLMAPEAGLTSTLTPSNMGGGTPLYRAPECAINFKRATTVSDIYSVGAILYDIFGGGQVRIPHLELTLAGALGPIVEKCTKTNPRRRYQSIEKLREDLFEVLSSENLVFSSQEEKEIVDLLSLNSKLTDQQWDRVFSFIDSNEANGASNHAVFRSISITHIEKLVDNSPDLLESLGLDYAKYAQNGTFDFDYCDVIASRAQAFFDKCELETQARLAAALLKLGTSHNRWYVERTFVGFVSPSANEALVERVNIEIDVQKLDRGYLFRRLRESIRLSDDALHPSLRTGA